MPGMDDLPKKPDKQELLQMLGEMVNSYERLPQHALITPVTHYDLLSVLLIVCELFRAED